jgi:hypothetical protein
MIDKIFLWLCLYLALITNRVLSQDTSDCGVTSGCFRVPANCGSQSCAYLVKWRNDSSNVFFQIYGNILSSGTNSYLAIGFSNDRLMGNDDVILCESAGPNVHHYFNNGRTPSLQATNPYQNVNITISGNWLSCYLTRPIQNSMINNFFDLTNSYHLLLASGTCKYLNCKKNFI